MKFVIVLICGCLILLYLIVSDLRRVKKFTLLSSNREKLDNKDFQEKYFPNESLETITIFRNALSVLLNTEINWIIPEDRLNKELEGEKITNMKKLFFINTLEKEFKIEMPSLNKCFEMNIGELLSIICHKLSEKNNEHINSAFRNTIN